VVLESVVTDGKTKKWADCVGPLFKNDFASADNGQLKFTGLTNEGETQYYEYLTQVREARADPDKRKFERDHLTWYKAKHGIVMSTYEEEMVRRANLNPVAGIANDTAEELQYSDKHLFPESDAESSGSESE
jgi:hypothetical protein